MSAIARQLEQLKRDYARQNAEWRAAQHGLAQLPADVRVAFPDGWFDALEHAALPHRAAEALVKPHCVRV